MNGPVSASSRVFKTRAEVQVAICLCYGSLPERTRSAGGTRRGPARSSLSAGKLRLVDHYVRSVSPGKLRLIVGAAALLVRDTVGDDGRAAGRKCRHSRSDDCGSDSRRCCNCGRGGDWMIAAASAIVVVIPIVDIHVDVPVYVDVRILIYVGVGLTFVF